MSHHAYLMPFKKNAILKEKRDGRRGIRCKQLVDNHKKTIRYSKLKREALDRAL
jgi:hypothetical protein